jgi:pyruvate kinase
VSKVLKKMEGQKTKIVATIGPACSSYEGLLSLAKAGVDDLTSSTPFG